MSEIIIYTKTGCPYCAAARKHYEDQGQSFTEYNVTEMPRKKEEALKASGGRAEVPIIVEDGKVTIGFGGS